MKFVTVSQDYYELCLSDGELLQKGANRPHVMVVNLKYKGKNVDFAVPPRSNIPPSAQKGTYFSLPPRKTTKPGHRHGLHYIKMFPIEKQYQQKFWTGISPEYILYQNIINKNQKKIVNDCQAYLNDYEAGKRYPFSVDIDKALQELDKAKNKAT